MAADIVINYAADGLVLCFIYAVVDLTRLWAVGRRRWMGLSSRTRYIAPYLCASLLTLS